MSVNRRNFLKGLAAGGTLGYFAMAGVSSTVMKSSFIPPAKVGTEDIGECKSVNVKVISETSWFDNATLMGDIKGAGGLLVNQYEIPWTNTGVKEGYNGDNAGGYATLIEVEQMDGTIRKFLLDTGWNVGWTDYCYKKEGIDKMLSDREIEFLIISHEHFDHYWGVEATLKYCPEIPIIVPKGFYQEGFDLLKGAEFPACHLSNKVKHTGPLEVRESGKVHKIMPGVASITFDVPIICRVFGEEVLVFNVKDKGICIVTGCCHMGIITLMEHVKSTIKGGEKIYGVQGGLHISPFEDWDPQYDDLVLALHHYGIEKLGCNHCTGYITAEKMIAANLPVVRGTARNKSKRDIYLGNGDSLVF